MLVHIYSQNVFFCCPKTLCTLCASFGEGKRNEKDENLIGKVVPISSV